MRHAQLRKNRLVPVARLARRASARVHENRLRVARIGDGDLAPRMVEDDYGECGTRCIGQRLVGQFCARLGVHLLEGARTSRTQ